MSTRSNHCPSTVLLVERALPAVFPLSAESLDAMRAVCALHDRARRRLADVALPSEFRPLAELDDGALHAVLRRATEQEGPVLELMAPDQIVWHVLSQAARLLG